MKRTGICILFIVQLLVGIGCKTNTGSDTMVADERCDSLQNMRNAFPHPANYQGFALQEILCLPDVKTYSLLYADSNNSRMDIQVRNISLKHNEYFAVDTKQTFEVAQNQYSPNTTLTNLLGNYGSIHITPAATDTLQGINICTFKCIVLPHYSVTIVVFNHAQLNNNATFEAFLKPYINTIALGKL